MRRRQGKGIPGGNFVEKVWFLAPPENPAQPIKSFCRLSERAKILLFEEVTL